MKYPVLEIAVLPHTISHQCSGQWLDAAVWAPVYGAQLTVA